MAKGKPQPDGRSRLGPRCTGPFHRLLHVDEGFWAGDRAAEGKLKDLITGHKHLIEFKGKDPFKVRNHIRLLVTGNADWVVPAALEERRHGVLDVGDGHMQDGAYFAAIDAEMNNGGREALPLPPQLRSQDSRPADDPEDRRAHRAEGQIDDARAELWLDTLDRGELPWGCDRAGDCPTNRLFDRYVMHAKRQGTRHRGSETAFGMFLHKAAPGPRQEQARQLQGATPWGSGDGHRL